MSYDAARPRYSLELAGKNYELLGTFELIEACEHALGEGIIRIAKRVMDMGVTDTAKLLAAMLTSSGHKATVKDMGDAILGLGIDSEEHGMLKIHLFAFLRILLSPPKDREGVAEAMGKLTGKLETASPGETTSDSA
ncbi:hypothetical protein [Tautonia plasticadhaerens]|uniref:Uncharacterized protein n=1 Tax=Tautonia plasticadhaerens TaxID=2527974 RepID=A0A518H246_9BACT|nr:hypothetical protein [Tautonia plasticadhaerens]QDV34900.1 hypothetical protein ElP_27970 [Tautonia plasticadhaerens]